MGLLPPKRLLVLPRERLLADQIFPTLFFKQTLRAFSCCLRHHLKNPLRQFERPPKKHDIQSKFSKESFNE
jgi:hypothetical protein